MEQGMGAPGGELDLSVYGDGHALSSRQLRDSLRRNLSELDAIQLRLRGLHDASPGDAPAPAPAPELAPLDGAPSVKKQTLETDLAGASSVMPMGADDGLVLRDESAPQDESVAGAGSPEGVKRQGEHARDARERTDKQAWFFENAAGAGVSVSSARSEQAAKLAAVVVPAEDPLLFSANESNILAAVHDLSSLFDPHSPGVAAGHAMTLGESESADASPGHTSDLLNQCILESSVDQEGSGANASQASAASESRDISSGVLPRWLASGSLEQVEGQADVSRDHEVDVLTGESVDTMSPVEAAGEGSAAAAAPQTGGEAGAARRGGGGGGFGEEECADADEDSEEEIVGWISRVSQTLELPRRSSVVADGSAGWSTRATIGCSALSPQKSVETTPTETLDSAEEEEEAQEGSHQQALVHQSTLRLSPDGKAHSAGKLPQDEAYDRRAYSPHAQQARLSAAVLTTPAHAKAAASTPAAPSALYSNSDPMHTPASENRLSALR
jgi:hypothetical protein